MYKHEIMMRGEELYWAVNEFTNIILLGRLVAVFDMICILP